MKHFLIILSTIIAFGSAKAQLDPKAKAILDEVSKKTKAYSSIKADFTISQQAADKSKKPDVTKGTILLKGDKFKLKLTGQEIISDTKTTWTYLADANEVQVNTAEPDAEGALNPSKIFTLYEKGYKYKYAKAGTLNGTSVDIINLYPENPDKVKFHTAKLYVHKTEKRILSLQMLMKDGSSVTYDVTKFSSNTAVNDATFTFNTKDHPGVDVVDLRD